LSSQVLDDCGLSHEITKINTVLCKPIIRTLIGSNMNPPPRPKKLLNQVRDVIRLKHYSIQTEQTYVDWIKRYIFSHKFDAFCLGLKALRKRKF